MEENKSAQDRLAEETTPCPPPETEAPAMTEEVPAEQTAAEEATVEETPVEETGVEETPVEETTTEETPVEQTATEEPTAEETPAPAKMGKLTIFLAALFVVLVLALLAVLVFRGSRKADGPQAATGSATEATVVATIPPDGNPDDVTCKGSYTVTDEEVKAAADTVVATIGDAQLTNSQLQIFYWSMVNSFLSSQNGYMMVAYGLLDYTQPLDTQLYSEGMTWQQCFLDMALDQWQMYQSLANAAQAEGMEMSAEDRENIDTLPQQMEATAKGYGMESVEELMLRNFGAGATMEDYAWYQELFSTGYPYYQAKTQAMNPTQEELEAYFAENEAAYAESGLTKDSKYVDVRHILLSVEGGTTDESGATTYSDEEWEACRVKAQGVLDQWLAGEKTEDSFATLANENSQDPGSNTTGGLYEDVTTGQMVEPFDAWCFDEGRTPGDYGLVKTSYGYHVMYFVGSSPIWPERSRADLIARQTTQLLEETTAANPMEVTYNAIALGFVNLAS